MNTYGDQWLRNAHQCNLEMYKARQMYNHFLKKVKPDNATIKMCDDKIKLFQKLYERMYRGTQAEPHDNIRKLNQFELIQFQIDIQLLLNSFDAYCKFELLSSILARPNNYNNDYYRIASDYFIKYATDEKYSATFFHLDVMCGLAQYPLLCQAVGQVFTNTGARNYWYLKQRIPSRHINVHCGDTAYRISLRQKELNSGLTLYISM